MGGVVQQLLMGSKAAIKRMHSCVTGSSDENEESKEESSPDYQTSRTHHRQTNSAKPSPYNNTPNLQASRGILSRTVSYGGDSLAVGFGETGTETGIATLKAAKLEKRPSFDMNSTKVHEINEVGDTVPGSPPEHELSPITLHKSATATIGSHRVTPASPLVRQAAAVSLYSPKIKVQLSPKLTSSPRQTGPSFVAKGVETEFIVMISCVDEAAVQPIAFS